MVNVIVFDFTELLPGKSVRRNWMVYVPGSLKSNSLVRINFWSKVLPGSKGRFPLKILPIWMR